MKTLDVINGLRVASPCAMSWDAMEGDDRSRYCGACAKYVYNIAAMKTPEIQALIRETQGDFCGQIYRRRDGTVLTGDCPVGVRAMVARRLQRVLALVVIGLGAAMAAVAPRSRTGPGVPTQGAGSGRTLGVVRGKVVAVPGGIRVAPPSACDRADGAP